VVETMRKPAQVAAAAATSDESSLSLRMISPGLEERKHDDVKKVSLTGLP